MNRYKGICQELSIEEKHFNVIIKRLNVDRKVYNKDLFVYNKNIFVDYLSKIVLGLNSKKFILLVNKNTSLDGLLVDLIHLSKSPYNAEAIMFIINIVKDVCKKNTIRMWLFGYKNC